VFTAAFLKSIRRLIARLWGGRVVSERPVTFADVASSLFEWSDLALAVLGHDLRIGAVNEAFLRHFGGTATQRVGQNFLDLLHPAAKDMLSRQFAKLCRGPHHRFTERLVGLGPGGKVFSGMLTGVAAPGTADRDTAIAVHIEPDGILRAASAGPPDRAMSALDARILEGVAAGASTIQLADRLHLSRQGIEYRIALLLRRFQAPNRAALVAHAYAMGALSLGAWPPRVLPEFTA
jgi:PAS domain S-box-containing protein